MEEEAYPADRSHPPWTQFLDHESGMIHRQSQWAKNSVTIGMKNVTQHLAPRKFVTAEQNRTYETLTSNETVENPVTSTCVSVVYPTQCDASVDEHSVIYNQRCNVLHVKGMGSI
jgi:hypothetical protein